MRLTTRCLASIACLSMLPIFGACISPDSGLGEAGKECDELSQGGFEADATIDANVRLFMKAAVDFNNVTANLKGPTRAACISLATDLGATDTWTVLGDGDDSITNSSGTGACDAANTRISGIMAGPLAATANFALVVTRGACHPDFEAQKACDARCSAQATCSSGTVETRCEPGSLSTQCQGSCVAQASCEGRTELPANCMGLCESTCEGACVGTCISAGGVKTDNDPNCHGKCSSSCNGMCRGRCKIEQPAGINCGAGVSCVGGCTGTYTQPTCETDFLPPQCTVDSTCYDSCSASVAAATVCLPPNVQLFANANGSADLQKLVVSVNANLPPLIALEQAQGQIMVNAAQVLVARGKAVLDAAGDLDGKSLACARVAATSAEKAAHTLTVSIQASVTVTGTCRSNSN